MHKWNSDYSFLLSTFNLLSLSTCCSISKLCLLYKITNNILYFPSDIFIHKSPPSHSSYHFDSLTFTITFSSSSASQNLFVSSILSLWNSLPYHVKSNSSLITFKSKVNMLIYPLAITYHTKTYQIPSITYFYFCLINHTTSSTLILFCLLLFCSVCAL